MSDTDVLTSVATSFSNSTPSDSVSRHLPWDAGRFANIAERREVISGEVPDCLENRNVGS